MSRRLPVTVIIPTLDAEQWIEDCLRSVLDQGVSEVIIIDGGSTDATVERAVAMGVRPVDHPSTGPAAARQAGVAMARSPWVAFVDADVILPKGAIAGLVGEADGRGLSAVSALFTNESSGGYWSDQLTRHHEGARSREWFGLTTAVIRRSVLEEHPLDVRLASGEDIDLRLRFERAGIPVGVARSIVVRHRYDRGWGTAVGQWTADGAGLGRLVRKDGMASLRWILLPVGAAILGILRSVRDGFSTIPYYVGHLYGNVVGLVVGLNDRAIPFGATGRRAAALAWVFLWLIGVITVVTPILVVQAAIELGPRFAQFAVSDRILPALTLTFVILLVIREVYAAMERERPEYMDVLTRLLVLMGILLGIGALLRLAAILGLIA